MTDVLPIRDTFAEYAHIGSDEMFAGSGQALPLLTIAIPTFRRPDLLAEAVASALAQDFQRPFEVMVVDDDPASAGHEQLLLAVPQIAAANFRYLRNRQNLQEAANSNRCIQLARAEWITILHDDDLLDPDFATEMFAQLEADPAIHGLVCRKRGLDCRDTPYSESRLKPAARQVLSFFTFGTSNRRLITARQLFWGGVVGNPVGFVFRVDDARVIGGFYAEDYPSADYYFCARFAQRFNLYQTNKVLATLRLAVNVSLRKDVQLQALQRNFALQQLYTQTVLPGRWLQLSPLLLARHLTIFTSLWGTAISPREAADSVGIDIPSDRPILLMSIRAALRGF